MIAGFVAAIEWSSGTLMLDAFAETTPAIVQRPTRIRSYKTAPSLPPSPPGLRRAEAASAAQAGRGLG